MWYVLAIQATFPKTFWPMSNLAITFKTQPLLPAPSHLWAIQCTNILGKQSEISSEFLVNTLKQPRCTNCSTQRLGEIFPCSFVPSHGRSAHVSCCTVLLWQLWLLSFSLNPIRLSVWLNKSLLSFELNSIFIIISATKSWSPTFL